MSDSSARVATAALRMAHYRARPSRSASERHRRTRHSGELSCHMTLKPIRTFNVVPTLPPALEGLRELAYNLRWCWNHNAVELFQRLDPEGWQTTHHNPVLLLGTVEQARLDAAGNDEGFLAHLRLVLDEFAHYLSGSHNWFAATHGGADGPLVAYFSAEFGLTECLPIFA